MPALTKIDQDILLLHVCREEKPSDAPKYRTHPPASVMNCPFALIIPIHLAARPANATISPLTPPPYQEESGSIALVHDEKNNYSDIAAIFAPTSEDIEIVHKRLSLL